MLSFSHLVPFVPIVWLLKNGKETLLKSIKGKLKVTARKSEKKVMEEEVRFY